MSEIIIATPDGAGTATTPPAVAGAVPPAVAPAAPQDLGALVKELIDERREFRKIMAAVKPNAPATTPAAPAPKGESGGAELLAEITKLRSEMAFKDALADAGVTDPKHKGMLSRLYTAERPDDLTGWIGDTVESLGFGKKPAAAPVAVAAPVVAPVTPSNSGAPVRGPNPQGGTTSIFEMSEEDIKKMTPAQINEGLNKATQVGGSNPYRNVKRSHEKG